MRVLVLGATGFIGGHVARAALARGSTVRATRRASSSLRAVDDISASLEWVEANLLDPRSLESAARGCEVVFHCAGYYPTVSLDRNAPMQKAVTGMRNALAAARAAGARRVVYTSSLSCIGKPSEPGRLADERDPYLPGSVDDLYFEAKWAMEQEAWRACAEGQDVVVTNPTIVFGPGDVKPTSGRVLVLIARRLTPLYVDAAMNVVDVRDVAAASVAAAESGRRGERYILGGHNTTVAALVAHIAAATGVLPPQIQIPGSLARIAALATEYAARFTRRPPLIPLEGVDMAIHAQHYDCTKAQLELGLAPRPLKDTLSDAVAWFRERGYLG